LPEWRAGDGGVEGVDGVVFGGDEEDVVTAFAGDFYAGEEERLGVDVSVDFEGEELAEALGVDIARGEDGFDAIGAEAGVVVLGGGDFLGGCSQSQNGEQEGADVSGGLRWQRQTRVHARSSRWQLFLHLLLLRCTVAFRPECRTGAMGQGTSALDAFAGIWWLEPERFSRTFR